MRHNIERGCGIALFDRTLLLRIEPRTIRITLGYCGCERTAGGRRTTTFAEHPIPHFDRKSVLQIINTHLTHILCLSTSLTNFHSFQSSLRPGLPGKYCKRIFANLTLLPVCFDGHADVGIVTQTCFTNERKFRRTLTFPALFHRISLH